MRVLSVEEVEQVSGAVSADAAYGAAVAVAGGMLFTALTVTAPVWGTALLLGASIASSGLAFDYAWNSTIGWY